ncbi:unnamed protein product [Ectocarpus fasciculatus]
MVHTGMRTLVPMVVAIANHYHGVASFGLGPQGVPVDTGRFSLFASSTSSVSSRCAAEVGSGIDSSSISSSSSSSMPGDLIADHRHDVHQQRRPPSTGQRQGRSRRRLLASNEPENGGGGGGGGGGRNRAAHRTKAKDESSTSVFRGEVSLSRASVLKGTSGAMAGLLLAGVGGIDGAPAAARAEQGQQQLQQGEGGALEEYASPDGSFALRYPVGFKGFSKPLKTHKVEVNFKSEEVKGYEVGVAIDPVRIESLETFGTPEEVGARVLKVEQAKDGTLDTKLLDTSAEKQGDLSLYTLDYFVESTRGVKHFVAKVTIKDNLLYACTAQAKEKDYPQVEAELKHVVESFRVPA